MEDNREYHGRRIRIPEPKRGYIQPAAGKIGVLSYAGWEDWYVVTVEGLYLCRARVSEFEGSLIPKIYGGCVK